MDRRILTVREPYASALAYGLKTYETRTRDDSYRGLVLIHAGLFADDLTRAVGESNRRLLLDAGFSLAGESNWFAKLPRGCVIGAARMTDACPVEQLIEQGGHVGPIEMGLGDFSAERWAWKFEHALAFKNPVSGWRGNLGLLKVPDAFFAVCLDQIHASGNELEVSRLLGPEVARSEVAA